MAFCVIWALVSCSGHVGDQSVAVLPSQAVDVDPIQTCPPRDVPAMCPPRVVPIPLEPSTPTISIPGEPGFWCSDLQGTNAKPKQLGVCHRVQKTCEEVRDEANQAGATATPCRQEKAAFCFTMIDTAKEAMFWRCYSSQQYCSTANEHLKVEYSKFKFSSCTSTAWAPGHLQRPHGHRGTLKVLRVQTVLRNNGG